MKNISGFSGVLIAVLTAILTLTGCAGPQREGFAIYLTKADIPPTEMHGLSQVEIAEQPVLSIQDIFTYNAQTHELKLTAGAFERISKLDVPVRGKSFVVCVDRKPVYWGAFWTPISSISFDGVTIWKPFNTQGPPVITLDLGYPPASFYGDTDPRNSSEIIKSLAQAGKLINKLSIETVDKLPRSMKGYELYSWQENGQWHFTLITGTNRNKTLDEITIGEDFISEAGWVAIHGVNQVTIKTAFSKLLQNEQVFWLGGMRSGPLSSDIVNITLPPGMVIEAIEAYAKESGLTMTVATR